MVRRLHLLVAIGATALLCATLQPAFADTQTCTSALLRAGLCTSGTSDGSGVVVTGTVEKGHSGSGPGRAPGSSGHPLSDGELLALFDDLCVGDGHCDPSRTGLNLNPLLPPGEPATTTPGDPAAVITITDLARFLPANATLRTEPDGWAVVGVPANFWVDVSAVTVTGELLGDTAQVRFTPEAYRFDYGDGSARTTSSGGASWAALGQEELTETPTSHVYRERADRRASVTVVYSAAYRFAGGPWIAVAGAVSGTTPQQRVLVVAERTALTTPG